MQQGQRREGEEGGGKEMREECRVLAAGGTTTCR